MSNFWGRYKILIILMFGGVMLYGQPKSNSPYSRIGLGDFWSTNFAALNGMADISAAYNDPYHVNINNPASLGYLYATSFEVGVRAKYGNLETATQSVDVRSGNLAYISLGFPIKNPIGRVLDRDQSKVNWGMNFSLTPYTTVGYLVKTEELRPEPLDLIKYNFEGTGGTYKFLWGNGVKVNDISFGANIGFLFGKIDQSQEVRFDSLSASYRDILLSNISHNAFVWNVGVQYDVIFKKKKPDGSYEPNGKQLTLGLFGNSNMDFNTKSTVFNSRFNPAYGSLDTISFDPLAKGSGKLPGEFSLGIMYKKKNKLKLGLDYSQAFWSQYKNESKNEGALNNTFRIAVGGELIPDISSYNSYGKRMRYRFGAFYSTDPRNDGFNEQLTSYGITIGLGFPVILPRQEQSFINVAFELGQFGSEQFLKETYAQMTVGFTLNDNSWFFKRKFN
ncbi:MAG: hypothetical protein ACI8P3_001735 [Saprospiraceae bacterium]|jgi:hypothetical protein